MVGSGDICLQVRDVEKSFGGERALTGVSLDVRRGEVHALIGANGAGKSTLVNVINGSAAADGGSVLLEGRPTHFNGPKDALRLGVATIHQHKALVPRLTVLENVQLGQEPVHGTLRLLSRRPKQRAIEALRRVGLERKAGARVSSLPSSQRQLVTVARAISWNASIVIFDEPTAELSPTETDDLFEVISRLRDHGAAVIYTTHRLEEVARVGDRVTVLRDGEVVLSTPARETDRGALVSAMAGRPIDQVFPERDTPPDREPGVVLRVEGASDPSGAYDDITLELRRGELLALVGLPDSGAAQLAEALAGARRMAAHRVLLEGRAAELGDPRRALSRGVAYLPRDREARGAFGPLPIGHTVTIAALERVSRAGLIGLRRDRALASQLLNEVGVRRAGEHLPLGSLSGGNQQRTLIARLLATEPRVLVCEDPTAGVDIAGRVTIYELLTRFCQRGGGVVLSSADLSEIAGLADRALVMREGKIVSELERGVLSERRLMYSQFDQMEVIRERD